MQFKLLVALFAVVMAICAFGPAEVEGDTTYHFDKCKGVQVCFKCCHDNGWKVAEDLTSFEFGCVCES